MRTQTRSQSAVSPASLWVRGCRFLPTVALLILTAVALVRTAWITDDAMITFRTVLNLHHGEGLTWNLGERVQVYTHPLWMGLLSLAYGVTQELFLTTMGLSMALTLLAVGLIPIYLGGSGWGVWIALTGLLFSRSFIDYGTSGLENPLSFLLLGLVAIATQRQRPGDGRNLGRVIFLSSLVFLNRMDLALVVFPLVLLAIARLGIRPRTILTWGALGSLPALGWLLFSLVYYGFPFPNTYYAKLEAGIPKIAYLTQGVYYYQDLLRRDPVSALLIVTALVSVLRLRKPLACSLAAGSGLYLLYILYIGGDFMSGRFFAVPVYLAALILAQLPPGRPRVGAIALASLVLMGGLTQPPLLSGRNYENRVWINNIADERGYYYPTYGLLAPGRTFPDVSQWGDRLDEQRVELGLVVGQQGLHSGPNAHIVDEYALGDALLARLPGIQEGWRVGHIRRYIPTGYIETLETGEDRFVDREVAQLYQFLQTIIRGDLFTGERLQAIAALNLGWVQPALDRERYQSAASQIPPFLPKPPLTAAQVAQNPKPPRTPWNDPGNWILRIEQAIAFPPTTATALDASLDGNDRYQIQFLQGGQPLGEVQLGPQPGVGLAHYRVPLPPELGDRPFDEILIRPLEGDGLYSLGHLKVGGWATLPPLPNRRQTLRLEAPTTSEAVSLTLNSAHGYRVSFLLGDERVGQVLVPAQPDLPPQLVTHQLPTPERSRRQGFDQVRIASLGEEPAAPIGAFWLVEATNSPP
ncbi:MAG: hypothetical protein VKK04_12950 [Synechococcales bacterium]|nr:hypothetical protein [Synechococcales bacterium]